MKPLSLLFCIFFPVASLAFVNGKVTGSDTLSIVMVSFRDVRGDSFYQDGRWWGYKTRHRKIDFEHILNTFGYPISDQTPPVALEHYAPNGDRLFAGLVDYFHILSQGQYQLTVTITNPFDEQGYPLWFQLPQEKSFYSRRPFYEFIREAMAAAESNGVQLKPRRTNRICFVYTGNRWDTIPPQVDEVGGRYMRVHERWQWPYDRESADAPLTHVGMYCHEYAHLLGAEHHRPSAVSLWDLMGNGQKNAFAGSFGNCPAPLNPWLRAQWGWLSLHECEGDAEISLIYHTAEQYYLYQPVGTSHRLLLENRQYRQLFDCGLPGHDTHANGGLLIWKIGDGSSIDLIEADGNEGEMNAAEDVFRCHRGEIIDIPLPSQKDTSVVVRLQILHVSADNDTIRVRVSSSIMAE